MKHADIVFCQIMLLTGIVAFLGFIVHWTRETNKALRIKYAGMLHLRGRS